MTGSFAHDPEVDTQTALLHSPIGAPGSGGMRYAAAMHFYFKDMMSAEMLEIYRRCSKFDREDPVDLARFEGVAIPAIAMSGGTGPSA